MPPWAYSTVLTKRTNGVEVHRFYARRQRVSTWATDTLWRMVSGISHAHELVGAGRDGVTMGIFEKCGILGHFVAFRLLLSSCGVVLGLAPMVTKSKSGLILKMTSSP